MPCPQSTDETEDFAGFLRRISSPPTPNLNKLEAFAKDWKAIEEQERREEEVRLDRYRMEQSDERWAEMVAGQDDTMGGVEA